MLTWENYTGSDLKLKSNIDEISSPLEKVLNLRGVSFEYKDDLTTKRTGVIAQELENILPGAVKTMKDGSKAVSYNDIVGLLIEAIKEQQAQIDELFGDEESQKTSSGNLKSESSRASNDLGQTVLYQNIPNPSNNSTEINLFIDGEVGKATVNVYNLEGRQIKNYLITQSGSSKVTIQAGELDPGIYIYNLIVDGREVSSKRMVLTD